MASYQSPHYGSYGGASIALPGSITPPPMGSQPGMPGSAPGSGYPPQPPPEVVPTVRVMRLYKPCLHLAPNVPYLAGTDSVTNMGSSFAISPFLLLPDSFGDIFVGETFSAYIAVLNGSEHTVYKDLSLNVKLQTSNASYDLNDSRPLNAGPSGTASTLSPGESLDIVVKHVLNEVGPHNLRVTVSYTTLNSRTNEVKSQKKYYKFSALDPLVIASSCSELNGKAMIQCQVTNAIKLPVYIEKMNFAPTNKDAEVKFLTAPAGPSSSKTSETSGLTEDLGSLSILDGLNLSDEELFNVDSLALLLPNESYAFAVTTDKPPTTASRQLGVPEVTWRLQMGESGTSVGERVFLPSFGAALGIIDGQMIRVQCISSPRSVVAGEDFSVTLRITNTTTKPTSVKIVNREPSNIQHSQSTPASSPQQQQQLSSSMPISFSRAVSGGGGVSALLSAIQSTLPTSDDAATGRGSQHQLDSASYMSQYNGGLCVTGLSNFYVSLLAPNESTDISVTVYALTSGLQELKSLSAIDMITGREYPAGTLFKVFVYDTAPSSSGDTLEAETMNESAAV